MGSDSSDGEGGEDQTAALNNIIQPLRKQIKKQSSKIEKLSALVKDLEADRATEKEKREEVERQLADIKTGSTMLKSTVDASPWRQDSERVEGSLRNTEKRLMDALDEQRVQLAAHAQVFQSTQSTVSDLSQRHATMQAEHNDGSRRAAEELRALTARLDHMRGEFSERVTHIFSESTSHADRLTQRLQEELHRLDTEVSMRAQARSVADGTAALQSEMQELRSANEELKRELRSCTTQLTELRETQQSFVTKSSMAGTSATADQRISALEETSGRLDGALREIGGALSDGRFGQRQGLIEGRQVTLERNLKQMEAQLTAYGEELAHRPLKTDVISAIAQQEVAVESCASKQTVERLESAVAACAQAASVSALEQSLRAAQEELSKTSSRLTEVAEGSATKAALAQRGKEIEGLRGKLEEKLGRDECSALFASKLDKSEARSILQQQEQLQAAVVGAEALSRRLQDALSSTTNQALDASGSVKQLNGRLDRLTTVTQELDARMTARKTELQSLTKVIRLVLDDAEMRCAIDEAEGATAVEATDVLSRLRGVSNRAAGAPMTVSGVTLHKPPGGGLQPMPPGSGAADKVWYKQSLQPRSDMLGARRRLLVNARHSWVGESCLARADTDAGSAGGGVLMPRAEMGATGSSGNAVGGLDCMLTPSSTGAEQAA